MRSEGCYCRVCGFESEVPQWGEDGRTPIYDYCPCCGVEHGYQDASPKGARTFREAWLTAGARWAEPETRPPNWSLDAQLVQVPNEFR